MVFEDFDIPSHKTKNMVNYIKQMEDAKKLLLVDGGPIDEKLKLATQNLYYVNLLPSIVSQRTLSIILCMHMLAYGFCYGHCHIL